MRIIALACLLATPALASGDVVGEWRDLQTRCMDAVVAGAMLDVSGLEARDPPLIGEVVDQSPFGIRIEYDALRSSARTVPTGIWSLPNGRFEMQLLEYTTKPGIRALCEVSTGADAPALTESEAARIVAAFGEIRDSGVEAGTYVEETFETDGTTLGMALAEPNPRECPVVITLTSDPAQDHFRSSAAERAGVPECGGPSLAKGGLTRPPASLNPRSAP